MKKIITNGNDPQFSYGKLLDCLIVIGFLILILTIAGIFVGVSLLIISKITNNQTIGVLLDLPFLYVAYRISKRILKKLYGKTFET